MSVLVVDDDIDVLVIIKKHIENAGDYSVTAVANASIALQLIKTKKYQVVIADVNMPGMNGIEFLRQVRIHDRDINAIMISGQAETDHVNRIKSMDALAFYTKPLAFDILTAHIEELCADINEGHG